MTVRPKATRHRWSDLAEDHPMPLLARRRVIAERMMISEVRLYKGCDVPLHAHENEQIAVVVSGKIRFRVGDELEELTLVGGEVLCLPSGVPHAAHAVEDTVVLDLFSPPSEGTGIDRRAHEQAVPG